MKKKKNSRDTNAVIFSRSFPSFDCLYSVVVYAIESCSLLFSYLIAVLAFVMPPVPYSIHL